MDSWIDWNVFTEPLLRNGLQNPVVLLLRACALWDLPSNDRSLQSQSLTTGLYATITIIIVTCWWVRVTNKMCSTSDDWIY
jgi:hypothetical protein